MNNLKKWDDINISDEKYGQRKTIISNSVNDFYRKVKNYPNIISGEEVYKLCDKFSFLSKSIWYDKICFRDRKNRNVIFALKSGIVFEEHYVDFLNGNEPGDYFFVAMESISIGINIDECTIIGPPNSGFAKKVSTLEDIAVLKDFINLMAEQKNKFDSDVESDIAKQNHQRSNEQVEFEIEKNNEILKFKPDEDGKISLIENDFNKLISKNQKKVIEIDKSYVHQFVKISNYIKTKEQNTQKIFESIKDIKNQQELTERVGLLKNQIHSYELLVFHSINMIGALVSEDLITFYEIYESFDKLGIYNSNWENEVSEKLINIGDKLDDLMYSIYNMEQNIVTELSHLSYVTKESFEDLNKSLVNQLKEVESSINTNNLLTGIQAYQLYKINKNTKGLRL